MNVIWVAEHTNKDIAWKQTLPEVLCFVVSVMLWKEMYPEDTTYFFCDETTKTYYGKLRILELFDHVDSVSIRNFGRDINKKVFWSCNKFAALEKIKAPLIMLDLDFKIYSDLKKLDILESDVTVGWMENINGFYLSKKQALRGLDFNFPEDFTWDQYATCNFFSFIKDDAFKKEYFDLAISYMKEASKLEFDEEIAAKESKYITFAEQKIFYELAKSKGLTIKSLMKETANTRNEFIMDYPDCGALDHQTSKSYFYHLAKYGRDLLRTKGTIHDKETNHSKWVIEKFISSSNAKDIYRHIIGYDPEHFI
jgi:hypothetical protein